MERVLSELNLLGIRSSFLSVPEMQILTGMNDMTFSVEIINRLEYFLEDYFENLWWHHAILPSLAIISQRLT
ncbi:unnamed protein product [Penicillium crustosum]